jgi:hypothetical protein
MCSLTTKIVVCIASLTMGVFLTVLKSIVYGFDGQAVGSRLADDTKIESLVKLLQFQQVGKHVVIHDLIGYARPIALKDPSVLLGLFQEIESRGSECCSRNQNEIAVELYSRCIQSIILHPVHTET